MSDWWTIVESFKTDTTPEPIPAESESVPVEQQPREDFDPLWGDPCPCGSREWRKLPGPILECQACGGLVRSRYLVCGKAARER